MDIINIENSPIDNKPYTNIVKYQIFSYIKDCKDVETINSVEYLDMHTKVKERDKNVPVKGSDFLITIKVKANVITKKDIQLIGTIIYFLIKEKLENIN